MADEEPWASRPFAQKYLLQDIPGFDKVPPDMRDALEKFGIDADHITHSLLEELQSQEPPAIIYHYTDDVGLRGILETGQLWLTDIFSLNDPSELSHGFSHAIKIINEKSANGSPGSRIFARHFTEFALQGGIRQVVRLFICSFSASGDDLGQWRAYADNGCGYALGFDAKALEHGFTIDGLTPIPNNSTFYVRYKDAELREIDARIIDKMFDLISLPSGRGLPSDSIVAYMASLQILLTLHVLIAALFFKHEGYANEREYRFLHAEEMHPPTTAKLRSRPYSLVRYQEFDWKKVSSQALREVVVGPAADRTKASHFAIDCLNLFCSGTVELKYSEIPYRRL